MAATVDSIALEALTRSMLDPTPRPLFGSKAKPGIFMSQGKGQKDAAVFLETKTFIEATDLVEGKTRKPLYRVSAQGAKHALENAEPVQLLREIKDGLQRLLASRDRIDATLKGMDQQQKVVDVLLHRLTTPASAPVQQPSIPAVATERSADWLKSAVEFVRIFERDHPNQFCPLPNIYEAVAKPTGVSHGVFQDGIRRLAHDGRLRLHPYTQPLYTIKGEECALVMGQEIKYYAQCINGSTAS